MERKVLLAVVLSSLVLLGYNLFFAKNYRLQQPAPSLLNNEIPSAQKELPILAREIKKENPAATFIPLEHKVLENNQLRLSFTNLGAVLGEIYLKQTNKKFFETQLLNLQEVANQPFKLVLNQDDKLIYEYADSQKKIRKIYSISNNTIELELVVENLSQLSQNWSFNLNYFSLNLEESSTDFNKDKNSLEWVVSFPDKIVRKSLLRLGKKDYALEAGKFNWLSLKDHYFCTIFKAEDNPDSYYLQLTDNKTVIAGIPINLFDLKPKALAKFKVKLYAGPLNSALLSTVDSGFAQIVNFGTFDAISKGLLSILQFVHKFLPNWGVCIIVLSCLLFFLLYPLTIKSLKSMKAMQYLQPEMEKLRLQYKDQPQKFNKEVMGLYKKNKINPLGGCLPMLLQMPIFFALYQALLRSLELRGSNFLWIKDLSEPDKLFSLPYSLPFLGNEFNILPILMALIMFFQQRLSSKGTVSVNPDQQKLMMIFFPIMFGVMFYHVASGLVLYWFVYSGLSLIFQWKQLAVSHKS